MNLRNYYFRRRLNVGLEGAIDSNANQRASGYGPWGLRQFRLRVELIVDAARNIGALPVQVTQASLVASDNSEADRIPLSTAISRSIGRDKEFPVIDAAAKLSGRSELFADGAHTTPPEGSQALAALVARGLAPHLR